MSAVTASRSTGAAPALRIGAAAAALETTPRTLRYYEQLGLLRPAARSTGGERRYGPDDLDRVRRVRALQEALGTDLDEVRAILAVDDRLGELRREYRSSADRARQREILDEASDLNASLQARVRSRMEALGALLQELRERQAVYDEVRPSLRG